MRATRHCQTAAIRHEETGLFVALGNTNYYVFCMGSLRDVMFRETGGVVVEESAEVKCLQERTLGEPAVHSQRQQVFWGGGVLGPRFRDFRLTLQFLTVILGGVRDVSFQMFGNKRMRECVPGWPVLPTQPFYPLPLL